MSRTAQQVALVAGPAAGGLGTEQPAPNRPIRCSRCFLLYPSDRPVRRFQRKMRRNLRAKCVLARPWGTFAAIPRRRGQKLRQSGWPLARCVEKCPTCDADHRQMRTKHMKFPARPGAMKDNSSAKPLSGGRKV